MRIDVWSDVACPFCYLGERRLEQALADFPHRDQVTVVSRSFELDPAAERGEHRPMAEALVQKFGSTAAQVEAMQRGIAAQVNEAGLPFDTSRAMVGNTADAHRLVHLADEAGLAREMMQALHRAYFSEGLRVGDADELVALAGKVGLDEARVREVLAGDEYSDAVRDDQARARQLGITGVPFFLFEDKYGVSGARSVAELRSVLDEVWAKEHPVQMLGDDAEGAVCTDDTCR